MKIVCRCEDITEEEILEAIDEGFCDLESLKRRLRLSSGPCQGRTCIPLVVRTLSRKLCIPPDDIVATTSRQPTRPVHISTFAGGEEE